MIFKGFISVCMPKIWYLRVFLNIDPFDLCFDLKGPDHLQKNLFLKNHKSFAMPKKISKT